jgi:hypothetical protein
MPSKTRYVLLGDTVGRSGREKVLDKVHLIQEKFKPDLLIANVENAAGGFGLTKKIYDQFLENGIDIMTSGNHIFDNKDIIKNMDKANFLLRPANYPDIAPGKGEMLLKTRSGENVLIINLQGRVFMPCINCPFYKLEELLKKYNNIDKIIVDFHAEATAEKQAFAHYFNGAVSAIIGTHTHVATTDATILSGGTAYITDVGMCGVKDSVIGMEKNPSINRFLTMTKVRFGPAKGDAIIQAVVFELNADGKCTSIEHIEIN